jgi:glycosyltransferase involved in cell wall biosynthesis
MGGQNVMIAHSIEVFRRDGRLVVDHLEFGFTRSWAGARSASVAKVVELVRVIGRLVRLRLSGPIDCLLYPVGGPHRNPIIRDLALLPFCYLTSRSVVLHFHAGGIANALPTFGSGLRALVRFVYSRAEGAVSLTQFGRQDPESLGIRQVAVVPNVLDDEYVEMPRADRSGRVQLLYVGHLCEDKGTPQLIAAFGSVAERFPMADLVLMGEPIAPFTHEEMDSLIEAAGVGDRVHRPGVVSGDDKWHFFAATDLFVFPSQAPYESFPLVLIEAMMWGLPIVTTRWRGIPEVVGSPPPGIVFDMEPDLESALGGALEAGLADPGSWADWGSRSRRRFLELRDLASREEPLVAYVHSLLGR